MKRGKEINITGKKVVSIDIGKHTTKIIEGQIKEESIILTHAISFPTPVNSCENGRIINFAELENSISSKLKSFKIKASNALCSVESSEIITRESTLPFGTDDEIEKMIEYEIQHMPIKLENYMILSKVLDFKEYDQGVVKIHALVTAIPNDIVYGYFDLLKSMKLKPVVFDTQSNVLDKLVSSEFINNEETSVKNMSFMVLDIGYGHINISIFDKGKYVFSRLLNMGAETIDHNLMQHLDFSQKQIDKYKFAINDIVKNSTQMEYKVDGPIENQVIQIVRNTIDMWIDRIEKVMHFYTTKSINNNIEHIYIYGGTSQINGFDRYIQQAYNIPVSHFGGITNITCDHFDGDDKLESYINALGTMIRR